MTPKKKLRLEDYSGLKDKLQLVLKVFQEYHDEALSEDTVLSILKDPLGIDTDEGRRLIAVLLRDGKIFSPRPGYYKLTGGA